MLLTKEHLVDSAVMDLPSIPFPLAWLWAPIFTLNSAKQIVALIPSDTKTAIYDVEVHGSDPPPTLVATGLFRTLDPALAGGWERLATIFDYDKAELHFKKGITLTPGYYYAYMMVQYSLNPLSTIWLNGYGMIDLEPE